MSFALINPRVWIEFAIAAAVAGLVWWAYSAVYDRGADSVQRKWDAVEKERSDASAKAASDALTVTKSLQESADKQRSASNAQISALNASLATAVAGLSNRPSRGDAGSVPGGATNGTGCAPSQLYREDAGVAIKLAGEADQLRIALQSCQVRYQSVYEALSGQK